MGLLVKETFKAQDERCELFSGFERRASSGLIPVPEERGPRKAAMAVPLPCVLEVMNGKSSGAGAANASQCFRDWVSRIARHRLGGTRNMGWISVVLWLVRGRSSVVTRVT